MTRIWVLPWTLVVLGPAVARAGSEPLDPEEDPDVAAAEAEAAQAEAEAPMLDYLTPLYSWAPPGAVQLNDAAVCHHIYGDWYGIAASYHVHGEHYDQDELWYVVVDGLSTWPSYGQFVTSARIDTYKEIRAVDCATDGASSTYVTWDRFYDFGSYYYYHKARLTRVQLDGYGNPSWSTPVEVGAHCGGGSPIPPATVYAGTPRVAWEPGGRLLVAFTTRLASGAATGCVLCVEAFDASSLAYVAANSLWGDLSQYPSFDVEWNGVSRFIVFHLFKADGSTTGDYWTALFDRGAVFYGGQLIDTGFLPQKTLLIFSDNSRNTYSRLLAFTKKKTYWIYQSGGKRGEYVSGTDRWYFGACEYWGPRARTGHSYTSWGTGWTYHQHWPTIPGGPLETYHVSAYLPLACSSSDTFTDPEVPVTSWTGLDPSSVYWNLEPED